MPPTRPQPPSDAKLFLIRIIGITLSIAGALACTFYGLRHYRNYAHVGKQPEEIIAAQAFNVPLDATTRWVRLKEPLNLNCDHALQQIDGGTVEFTEFLAYDETGKYAFLLEYKGDTDCAGTRAIPFEGVLDAAPIRWWTMNNMPYPTSEPVEATGRKTQRRTEASDLCTDSHTFYAGAHRISNPLPKTRLSTTSKPTAPGKSHSLRTLGFANTKVPRRTVSKQWPHTSNHRASCRNQASALHRSG